MDDNIRLRRIVERQLYQKRLTQIFEDFKEILERLDHLSDNVDFDYNGNRKAVSKFRKKWDLPNETKSLY
jgi:hypothetical protein